MSQQPRLTSVMGVARALLATLAVDDAVDVLVTEFGWDVTFQALSLLRGPDADEAFGRCWEWLVTAGLQREVEQVGSWAPDASPDVA